MGQDPKRRAEWALIAVLGAVTASGSSWLVKLSPSACIAEWNIHEILDDDATVSAVRLVSDSASHAARYDNPELDPRAPVVEWCLGGSGGAGTGVGLPTDTSSVPVEVRVFPDHDEQPRGFFPVVLHLTEDVAPPIGAASPNTDCFRWNDFNLHPRLKRWGLAKRDPNDSSTWVWLPEVRLILRWQHDEATYYLDTPLWRTVNVMNKLDRCTQDLRLDDEAERPSSTEWT